MPRPRFPLADYIDERASLRHQLSSSGMRGQLRSLPRAIRSARPASEGEVVELLAGALRVAPERIFLTHGASEGNALVLLHLERSLRRQLGRRPRARVRVPEYPPLRDGARFAGFALAPPDRPADVVIRSDPNNPTGLRGPEPPGNSSTDEPAISVVDETFREFSATSSGASRGRDPGRWTIGTLTKAYGADEVRLGFVVAPPEEPTAFTRTAGLLTDEIGASSRAQAAAILRSRDRILEESRAIFGTNLRLLRRSVRGVPRLAAPIWFDRPGLLGRDLAHAAEQAGVLVVPGDHFGDPTGVRVCLTRRSFPEDLAAYLQVRSRMLEARRRDGAR